MKWREWQIVWKLWETVRKEERQKVRMTESKKERKKERKKE